MEDQIIGIVCALVLFVTIGAASHKKRKLGENFPGAKYKKDRG